jgi:hypothetical protein
MSKIFDIKNQNQIENNEIKKKSKMNKKIRKIN